MNRAFVKRDRAEQAQYISTQLLPQIALLTRLLIKEIGGGYSWTEAGLLKSLSDGPRRITELAELEGLAQPTTTLLVKRLEQQGLVRRERQADDQRVVLVWLTDAGVAALEHLRALASTALLGRLDAMPDDQLNALTTATDALAQLITALLNDTPQRGASQ
jgi:DNA-binding MarR family transcriptional regulator